jgi:hypothetical protein
MGTDAPDKPVESPPSVPMPDTTPRPSGPGVEENDDPETTPERPPRRPEPAEPED